MSADWFTRIYLEDEQTRLLSWMVESERELPLQEHGPFILAAMSGANFLVHSGIGERPPVRPGDLDTLADHRLLRRRFRSRNRSYEITPEGRRYYGELRRRAGEPVSEASIEIKKYLESESFQKLYSVAYERWRNADAALWDASSDEQFTQIGHSCREAMQAFASALAAQAGIEDLPDDPAKTVVRVRAVLDQHGLAGRHRAFLDALLAYWGTVSDLVQRQEHGAGKQGKPLKWEDARRVVFQTMVVMFEIAGVV